jgi:hypothetical protein
MTDPTPHSTSDDQPAEAPQDDPGHDAAHDTAHDTAHESGTGALDDDVVERADDGLAPLISNTGDDDDDGAPTG